LKWQAVRNLNYELEVWFLKDIEKHEKELNLKENK